MFDIERPKLKLPPPTLGERGVLSGLITRSLFCCVSFKKMIKSSGKLS